MKQIPQITIDYSKSDYVKSLIEKYEHFDRLPFNMESVMYMERTLRALDKYVSLIVFVEDYKVGVVDVDMTIDGLKKELDDFYSWRLRCGNCW